MSTLFRYTCREFVIRRTPREQPRPLFIFTLRGKHGEICGVVEAINHQVIRHLNMKSGGGWFRGAPVVTHTGQV